MLGPNSTPADADEAIDAIAERVVGIVMDLAGTADDLREAEE